MVCTAGKHKICWHFLFPSPSVVGAWGRARHFLSTEQPLLAEFPASNERTNTTTRSLGEGLLHGGAGLEQGLLEEVWMLDHGSLCHLLGVHLG